MINNLRDYFSLQEKPNLAVGVNLNTERLLKAANWVKTEYALPSVSLNKKISKLLIGNSATTFSRKIIDWLSRKIKEIDEDIILFTDIEILFQPSLKLNPLTIFNQISRNTSLLVMWPGEFKNNTLSYASPEHAHYRTWANPGVEIIQV